MSLDLTVFDRMYKEHYSSAKLVNFAALPAFPIITDEPGSWGFRRRPRRWVMPVNSFGRLTAVEPTIIVTPVVLDPPTDREIANAYDAEVRAADGQRKIADLITVKHGQPERESVVTIGEAIDARRRLLAAKTSAADAVRRDRDRRFVLGPVDDGDEVGAVDALTVLDRMASLSRR